ncbi:MAG: DoxX family protein [Planctomycetaceae bacterium]|nr:DoxX family protein [Planctomycetaceae bacterium]
MVTQKKFMTRAGWALTILLAVMLTMSGVMKLAYPEFFQKEWEGKLQYPAAAALAIGIVELACVLVYLYPRTAILGAVLLTGYLGGATATHVRINDPFFGPVVIGMLVWLAIYLREPRVRELLPWCQARIERVG